MSYQRYQRVTSLLQEQLNKVILREMEFAGALVTVTEVQVQKDLDYADVYVSVIPNDREQEIFKMLVEKQKYLEHVLFKKINIKPMPVIRFLLDKGLTRAAELEKILIQIAKENEGQVEKENKGE